MKTSASHLITLLNTARQGNQDAFSELITHYQSRLFVHCYRMLGSTQDAEDAVQETSLRVWRRLGAYSGVGSFQSWVYAIATNICLDLLRKRAARSLIQPNSAPLETMPTHLKTPLGSSLVGTHS